MRGKGVSIMKMLGKETDDRGRIQIYVYMNNNDYVFVFYDEHTNCLWTWCMDYMILSLTFWNSLLFPTDFLGLFLPST